MGFWQAWKGLEGNPIYRWEARRHRRVTGGVVALLVFLQCTPFGLILAPMVVAAYAAALLARSRRDGTWDEVRLAALTDEELLLGRVAGSCDALLGLLALGLVWAFYIGVLAADGMAFHTHDAGLGTAAEVLAFVLTIGAALCMPASAMAVAAMAGTLAGLRMRHPAGSAAAAATGTALLLTLSFCLTLLALALVSPSRPSSGAPVAALAIPVAANALSVTGLWRACLQAMRSG